MSKKQVPDGRILVVDDNKAILAALKLLLPSYFAEVTLLSSPGGLMGSMAEKRPEVVLLDMNFAAQVTIATIADFLQFNPNTVVLLLVDFSLLYPVRSCCTVVVLFIAL